jgi:hypothetical protein
VHASLVEAGERLDQLCGPASALRSLLDGGGAGRSGRAPPLPAAQQQQLV